MTKLSIDMLINFSSALFAHRTPHTLAFRFASNEIPDSDLIVYINQQSYMKKNLWKGGPNLS
jgi:hypothetical protein